MKFADLPESRDIIVTLEFGKDLKLPTNLAFHPYQQGLRIGVDIAILFDETINDPKGADMAFLRYAPGSYVPDHIHIGFESVLVLQGDYIENGRIFLPGTLIVRAPGTCHCMTSQNGCVILASRYMPVKQLAMRS